MRSQTLTHRYAPSGGLVRLCRCQQYRTTPPFIRHVSPRWWSRPFFASVYPRACWPGCKQLSRLPPLRIRWSGPLPLNAARHGGQHQLLEVHSVWCYSHTRPGWSSIRVIMTITWQHPQCSLQNKSSLMLHGFCLCHIRSWHYVQQLWHQRERWAAEVRGRRKSSNDVIKELISQLCLVIQKYNKSIPVKSAQDRIRSHHM